MLEYPRDIPEGADSDVVEAEIAHVRAHLSAIASTDDDPDTNAENVDVVVTRREDGGLRVTGYLDATITAPYLAKDYNPLAGIDPELLKEAGL